MNNITSTNSVTNYFDIADRNAINNSNASATAFSEMLQNVSSDSKSAKESEELENANLSTVSDTEENTEVEGENTVDPDENVDTENDKVEEENEENDGDDGADDTTDDKDDDNDGAPAGTGSGNNSVLGDYRPDGVDPYNPDDGPSDSLSFTDMLQLMILQFQSQTMDNTASTTDMMNQLTQMTSVQAITEMNVNIAEMVGTNSLLYTSSLVGKEVTVGYIEDGKLYEVVGTVTGSGYYDGQPVIFFSDGSSYYVSDIMAVGRLPDNVTTQPNTDDEEEDGGTDGVDPDGGDGGTDGVDPDGGDGGTDGVDPDGGDGGTDGVDPDGGDGGVTVDPDAGESTDGTTSDSTETVNYDAMTPEEFAAASAQALG